MDAEFINAYIARQKALIDELQTKVLLLETKYSIIEQQNLSLRQELEDSKPKKTPKGE